MKRIFFIILPYLFVSLLVAIPFSLRRPDIQVIKNKMKNIVKSDTTKSESDTTTNSTTEVNGCVCDKCNK